MREVILREVIFVDSANSEAYHQAVTDKTRAVYIESAGNPKLDVPDSKRLQRLNMKQKSLLLLIIQVL